MYSNRNICRLVISSFVFLFVQTCYTAFPSDSIIIDTTLEDSLYTHELSSSNTAALTNLEVNIVEPIPSPQMVLTPFFVTILANRDNFNGRVYLRSALGAVQPTYVDLVNGKWVGNVSLFEIGKNNHLILQWDNEDRGGVSTSVSNVFDTHDLPDIYQDKNNGIEQSANLVVNITNSDDVPIDGAETMLFSDDINKCKQTIIPSTKEIIGKGKYKFNNIWPGIYHLEIHKSNYQDIVKKVKLAAKRTTTVNISLNDTCNAKGKIPVLLVPGIMGSYSKEKAYVVWPYPRLPPNSPEWDSDELKLLDPFGYVGWSGLTKELQKHGYVKGCTIFDVPYDWSLSIPEIRDRYLIPWIEYAKRVSGSNKVDIVAHSMGGLVTRSYVQSDLYKNDVRKLAMVGTPSKGGAAVYYIWESGSPVAADNVSEATGIFNPTAYFYSNTLDQFYYDRYWNHICKFDAIRKYKPLHCNKKEVYKTIHNEAMSSGQLMPIYDDALLLSAYSGEIDR